MELLIKKEQACRLLENLKKEPDSLQSRLYSVLKERTLRNTGQNCLVQEKDTQEWYHLVWERMADAAFLYHMEKDEALGRWIHDRVMEICSLSKDAWKGPWYRVNAREGDRGALETAHITLAVCEALANAGELFDEPETELVRSSLKEKGMVLCRNFIDHRWNSEKPFVNNWEIVLLNAYGTAAVLLAEEEEIRHAKELEGVFAKLYNTDSYGESVQYSNYTSLHFSYLHQVFVNSGRYALTDLHPECYYRMIKWQVYSFQRMKYLETLDAVLPRTFAFGDSSNLFRPTGEVLARTAVWGKKACQEDAGLASWLFETIYQQEKGCTDELASFGFFNQFGYQALLLMPDMAAPLSPAQAKLPLMQRFEVGHVLARDSWENPTMMVAIAAGYEPLQVAAHRHADQNSFQLTVGQERMLIDPGHCCYRLKACEQSKKETAHNMASVLYQGKILEQKLLRPSCLFNADPVHNHLIKAEQFGEYTVVASDVSELYDWPVERMVRIWVMKLPEMVMVIDDLLAKEPVKLVTRFVANNRDNRLQAEFSASGSKGADTQNHPAPDQIDEILLSRKGETLKICAEQNLVDGIETGMELKFGWSYLHDYYHPLPNQAGQGKEGSALVYEWEDCAEGKHHQRIHVLRSI